jgi:hypothetical protein
MRRQVCCRLLLNVLNQLTEDDIVVLMVEVVQVLVLFERVPPVLDLVRRFVVIEQHMCKHPVPIELQFSILLFALSFVLADSG